MRGYTQLTQEQRYQIHALMKAGHCRTEIARIIDVHKSTISRESARNRGLRGYRPTQAHRFTMNRRQYKAEEETVNKVDTRAMWKILAENLASSRKRFIDFDQDVMHEKGRTPSLT